MLKKRRKINIEHKENKYISTCHLVVYTLVVGSISRVGVANTSWCLQVNQIRFCRATQQY
jgi:hypothetical protein